MIPEFSKKTSLIVHILCPHGLELKFINKWEELSHGLPALKSLSYVFIGENCSDQEDSEPNHGCNLCVSHGEKTYTYSIKRGSYQEFKQTHPPPPDLVLVQVCHFLCSDRGWTKAEVTSLLHKNGAPLIFTSNAAEEARKDMESFLGFCDVDVDILINCEENEMRSHRGIRNHLLEDEVDMFYSNHTVSVVRMK